MHTCSEFSRTTKHAYQDGATMRMTSFHSARFLVNIGWNCLATTPWIHMPTWMSTVLLFLQFMIGPLDVRSVFRRFWYLELPVEFSLRHQVLWCCKIVYINYWTRQCVCIYSLMVKYEKKYKNTILIFKPHEGKLTAWIITITMYRVHMVIFSGMPFLKWSSCRRNQSI